MDGIDRTCGIARFHGDADRRTRRRRGYLACDPRKTHRAIDGAGTGYARRIPRPHRSGHRALEAFDRRGEDQSGPANSKIATRVIPELLFVALFDAYPVRTLPIEVVIDARLDFLHVERRIRCVCRQRRRGEIEGLRTEAEVIVFHLGRPIAVDRIFEAGAGGPAGPGQRVARAAAEHVVECAAIVGEGDTALAVHQQTIECRADPAGGGRSPFGLGVDRVAERVRAVAFEAGPVEIAFDAEHEGVVLDIVADLATADKTVVGEFVMRAAERIAPAGVGETAADIAADVKSGPVVDRRRISHRRYRRGHPRRRQIGRFR